MASVFAYRSGIRENDGVSESLIVFCLEERNQAGQGEEQRRPSIIYRLRFVCWIRHCAAMTLAVSEIDVWRAATVML